MPRGPRLDAPGALHHVIARGIERRPIFVDDEDRASFLARLAPLVTQSRAGLYAWALIPNHFHLLLRTGAVPLSSLVRRLLTGYVGGFNRRHRRAGHLFQNRFKSILVEDDPYLLSLVRYIHLNPLRAGLVGTIEELDTYPWAGHAVLLGTRAYPAQDCRAVLAEFADGVAASRRAYRTFIAARTSDADADLDGGGLRRSRDWCAVPTLPRGRERWSFDERILGSGPFVEHVMAQLAAVSVPVAIANPRTVVATLCAQHAAELGIAPAEICGRSLRRPARQARVAVCRAAVRHHGVQPTTVARLLGISVQSVLRATNPLPTVGAAPTRSARRRRQPR